MPAAPEMSAAVAGGPAASPAGDGGPAQTTTLLPPPDAAMAGASAEDKCGEHRFDLERRPAELLLVLDRSASMKDAPDGATDSTPKWELVVPAITQVIQSTDTSLSWGLKTFPENDGKECEAGAVTSKVQIALAAMNAGKMSAAIAMTTPEGNGTPTGDAVAQGLAYLKALPDKNPKYLLLATDGEPSCPKPSESARAHAVESISMAAAAGIHTFVLGVATTKKSATSVLNDMAIAGMEPRTDHPNPLAGSFYLANTRDQLVTALQTITGQISGCTFSWDEPPPVPGNIAVKVGGVKAPQDAKEGWEYTGADHKGVEVRGAWCEKIRTAASNRVEIVFGCPDVEIL